MNFVQQIRKFAKNRQIESLGQIWVSGVNAGIWKDYINYIRNLILLNDLQNGTYQLDQNLNLSKMTKKQMLQEGKFIFGIKKEFPSIEFLNY